MRSLLARLAALGALAAVMSGCSTSTSPLPVSGTASGGGGGPTNLSAFTQSGYVRFVFGNPNYTAAAPVFVCLDQSTLGSAPLAYGSTVATTVPAGTHFITVYPPATAAAAAAGRPSPCVNAPNNVAVLPPATATAPLAIYTVAFAANTRYSIVFGGTGAGPNAYGYTDTIPQPVQAVPAALFHNVTTTIPPNAATPPVSSAVLGFTPTGGTATAVAGATQNQVTPQTPGKSPPSAISLANTTAAVAINPSLLGPGAFFVANATAATTPLASRTVTGTTAPVTSFYALDAAAGAYTLLAATDPSFAQLGF